MSKSQLITGMRPVPAAWRRVASSFSEFENEESFSDSAVPRVLKALLAKIDAGEYEPGKKINTVQLADDLKLSRAPIREALHILAGKGIVTLLPDRGAVLRPFTKARLIETLEVLHCLFNFALARLATKIDENDNRQIIIRHQQLIATAAAEESGFSFWFYVHDFLYDVGKRCGNSMVDEIISTLSLDLCARTFDEYVPLSQGIAQYAKTFHKMTEALIDGDWRSAVAAAANHMEWQINALREAGGD